MQARNKYDKVETLTKLRIEDLFIQNIFVAESWWKIESC